MDVLFSGIQPSNQLMLGTYLGALKNWVVLQNRFQSLFCLVDLHAITVKQDPELLRQRTLESLAIYLAVGIDPARSILFVQSQVPEHAELAWLLTCHSHMGELSRMTQFKDKSASSKQIGVGLFTYPVLMAADILLYGTKLVPVGEDQKQHLELTRDLAERMNFLYPQPSGGAPLFQVPEVYIPPVGARVMSLQDPTKKMSKSDPVENATIFLLEESESIVKKFKRAVTDSGTEVSFDPVAKPGVANLLTIQAAILGTSPDAIASRYVGKQYGHLKLETAELVVTTLKPIATEAKRYLGDPSELMRVLNVGRERARELAAARLQHIKRALGFVT